MAKATKDTFSIERFRVDGLHGRKSLSVDITIQNNRLVLVGENGSGKTTLISLLFLVLSRQWTRLFAYRFTTITVEINGKSYEINRPDAPLEAFQKQMKRRQHHISPEILDEIRYMAERSGWTPGPASLPMPLYERISWEISNRFDLPPRVIFDVLSDPSFYQLDIPVLNDLTDLLTNRWSGQFVYLPTYRRIEQDLKSIFPTVDVDRIFRESVRRSPTAHTHMELVEFGMNDVEAQIEKKMKELRNTIAENLKALTATYLSEIIGGKYKQVTESRNPKLRQDAIEPILARIEKTFLADAEKLEIQNVVKLLEAGHELNDQQQIIGHFVSKLVQLYSEQQKRETETQQFVNLCNKYLKGKQLSFNVDNYSVVVNLLKSGTVTKEQIELRQLSSGEKQIVSLFSHIFLSDFKTFFLLIDEPELSLSVTWQKTFLKDIFDTKRCDGLIAVTHSPFIFENEFDSSAHSIEEFWQ